MAAPARTRVFLPDGRALVCSVGVGETYSVTVLDNDDTPRDLSNDTLTVDAKLGTTGKTLSFAADADQTANKGLAHVGIPAAELDAAGELYIDLKVQKSGGEANIVFRHQITVEDSDAD